MEAVGPHASVADVPLHLAACDRGPACRARCVPTLAGVKLVGTFARQDAGVDLFTDGVDQPRHNSRLRSCIGRTLSDARAMPETVARYGARRHPLGGTAGGDTVLVSGENWTLRRRRLQRELNGAQRVEHLVRLCPKLMAARSQGFAANPQSDATQLIRVV